MSLSDNHLIIGTRGSRLALIQSQLVADALKREAERMGRPGLVVEAKIIKTTGDLNQSPVPLDMVGKSWFTGEIEHALAAGEIDLAVHSLKDMALDPVVGLETLPVLERADPCDVLISRADAKGADGKSGAKLADLPAGAVIGTDSVRRRMLILERRPDLIVTSVRGNVDSRIQKLRGEIQNADGTPAKHYDALVLAAAGLERLGMLDVVSEFFDPATFLPVSGQGVLAAQIRATQTSPDQADLLTLIKGIQHQPTCIAAAAELAFSRTLGGGCKMPIGCYARIEGDKVTIHAVMQDPDKDSAGKKVIRKSASGPASDAVHLAQELAKSFL